MVDCKMALKIFDTLQFNMDFVWDFFKKMFLLFGVYS